VGVLVDDGTILINTERDVGGRMQRARKWAVFAGDNSTM